MGGTLRLKDTPVGSLVACFLIREIPSGDLKVYRSRWELVLGFVLLRSITDVGVIMVFSFQGTLTCFRMCSLKILKGGRFTESGVFLRFLNTSF